MAMGDGSSRLEHSELAARLLQQLPDHMRARVADLSTLSAASCEDLLAQIEGYSAVIDKEANRRGDLDVDLANELSLSFRVLFEKRWKSLSSEQRYVVQLACRYYLDPRDGSGDLGSVYGFEDDALMFNLVMDMISEPGLKINI